MFTIFINWVLRMFGVKVGEVKKPIVKNREIVIQVTYTHPRYPLSSMPRKKPQPTKQLQKVTADDIRSWARTVREYDAIRSVWT